MSNELTTNLVIITGLSGAGKTSAAEKLEDLGYYVIDNLPYELFNKFLPMMKELGMKKVALTININEHNQNDFNDELLRLKENDNFKLDLFYFYASKTTLIKRYKETRRSHPLAVEGLDIELAIEKEERILHTCSQLANHSLDTTNLKPAKLKEFVAQQLEEDTSHFKVIFLSFGFKYGIPINADLVFDARFLPNPFYIEELRNKTGLDEEVYEYVFDQEETKTLATKLNDLVDFCVPQYINEGRNEIVIAIGCTGGQHRSVSIARYLHAELVKKNMDIQISLKHRERGSWHA